MRGRILHLEDDTEWIAIIRHLLGDEYEVVSARNLEEAQRLFRDMLDRDMRFDLAVIDISLQGGDAHDKSGFQLIEFLLESGVLSGHNVILLSAFSDIDDNLRVAFRNYRTSDVFDKFRFAEEQYAFKRLVADTIERMQFELHWAEWKRQIEAVLHHDGTVSPADLSDVPAELRARALEKYAKGNIVGFSLVQTAAGGLRFERNADAVGRWHRAWDRALVSAHAGAVEQGALDDLADTLAHVTRLERNREWLRQGDLWGTTVTRHVFRLNVPASFPLIFVPPSHIAAELCGQIVELGGRMGQREKFFALIVPLAEDAERLNRFYDILRNTPYADNFVAFLPDDILGVFTGPDPVVQLARCMSHRVSPSALSPFVVNTPVSGPMFYGRERELRDLVLGLDQRSFAIVGNRHIGKTSLVQRVKQVLESGQVHAATLLSLQSLRAPEEIGGHLRIKLGLEVPDDPAQAFRAVVTELRARSEGRNVVLLIDEPDWVLLQDKSPQSNYRISSVWRELSEAGECRFVIAGHRVLAELQDDGGSPFFNFGERIPLKCLPRSEAEPMITVPFDSMGIELKDAPVILERIWQVSAGHPLVIQYIGQALLRQLRRGESVLDPSHLDRVLSDAEFASAYSKSMWGSPVISEGQGVAPIERAILLLGPPDGFTESEIGRWLGRARFRVSDAQISSALRMLTTFGLLDRREKVYTCTVPHFLSFIHRWEDVERQLSAMRERVNL